MGADVETCVGIDLVNPREPDMIEREDERSRRDRRDTAEMRAFPVD